MSDPYSINAKAAQIKDADGVPQSGFGYISTKVPWLESAQRHGGC